MNLEGTRRQDRLFRLSVLVTLMGSMVGVTAIVFHILPAVTTDWFYIGIATLILCGVGYVAVALVEGWIKALRTEKR